MNVDDLIMPEGRIAVDLLGDETLTHVAAWITVAATKLGDVPAAAQAAAQAAYVYHLAFDAKASAIAALPADYGEDGHTMRHTSAQIAYWRGLANEALAEYRNFRATPATPGRPMSSYVATTVVF